MDNVRDEERMPTRRFLPDAGTIRWSSTIPLTSGLHPADA